MPPGLQSPDSLIYPPSPESKTQHEDTGYVKEQADAHQREMGAGSGWDPLQAGLRGLAASQRTLHLQG